MFLPVLLRYPAIFFFSPSFLTHSDCFGFLGVFVSIVFTYSRFLSWVSNNCFFFGAVSLFFFRVWFFTFCFSSLMVFLSVCFLAAERFFFSVGMPWRIVPAVSDSLLVCSYCYAHYLLTCFQEVCAEMDPLLVWVCGKYWRVKLDGRCVLFSLQGRKLPCD